MHRHSRLFANIRRRCELREPHIGVRPRPSCRRLGVKGSQVQVLSARPAFTQVEGSLRETGPSPLLVFGCASNGRAESGLLPLGDYYVVETSAPAGFELDASRHYGTLQGGGDVELTIQAADTPTPPDWGGVVVFFRHSRRATMQTLAVTKHGFTFHEPDQILCLLEDAGFDSIEMIPGSGPRGAFICAIATKPGPSAVQ